MRLACCREDLQQWARIAKLCMLAKYVLCKLPLGRGVNFGERWGVCRLLTPCLIQQWPRDTASEAPSRDVADRLAIRLTVLRSGPVHLRWAAFARSSGA